MEQVKGIEGKLVRLVPISMDRHLDNYYRWLNDPEVTENLLIEFPLPYHVEKDLLEQLTRRENDVVFAVETLAGKHLGSSAIHNINWKHHFAVTGSFIGDADERGKGYGTEAAVLRSRYAFHVLGLRQLHSSYLGTNERSRKMQEKLGCVEVGRWPGKYWKRGEFKDEVLTLLTKEAFEKHHGTGL